MRIKYLIALSGVLFTASCSWVSRKIDTNLTASVINAETRCGYKEAWQIASKNNAFYYYEKDYILKKVYLKMLEAKFTKLFKKSPSEKNYNEPYIASQENNAYIIKGQYRHSDKMYGYEGRFTFEGGLLKQYETIDDSHSYDATYRLPIDYSSPGVTYEAPAPRQNFTF